MKREYKYDFNSEQYSLIASYILATKSFAESVRLFEVGSRDCADAFFLISKLHSIPNIEAHCFDPHPKFLDLSNSFSNMTSRIKRHNCAISEESGFIDFFTTDTTANNSQSLNDHGIGASSIKQPITNVPNMPTVSYDTVKVKSESAANICKNLGVPDVLILDVQGRNWRCCAVSAPHCQKRLLFF